ncbi:hypothetical protein WJX73_004541 [Symbiochloris irregularis]|uniref:Uncharacterized protein n=1 Tax=Symbiochloris irregularis TaxID=706552 RepID=A0AAW1NS26_9CHLO
MQSESSAVPADGSFSKVSPVRTADDLPSAAAAVGAVHNHSISAPPTVEERPAHTDPPATSAPDEAAGSLTELLARVERATTRFQHAAAGASLRRMSSISLYSQGGNPSTLLTLGVLCLALGQAGMVASMLKWLLSFQNIMTLVGLMCLALTASSSLNRVFNMFALQVEAIGLGIPKLPVMAEEISQMLVQIKLMRQDLQLMRSKVSWLPGAST